LERTPGGTPLGNEMMGFPVCMEINKRRSLAFVNLKVA